MTERRRLRLVARTWGQWEQREFDKARAAAVYGSFIANIKEAWMNNRYHVQVYECSIPGIPQLGEKVLHAAVGRHGDLEPITWDELQQIKDELFGEDRCAIEVYPPREQFVNLAKLRHLWVLEEGKSLPFGLHTDYCWGKR